MKIVVATIACNQENEYKNDIKFEEVEFDGSLKTLAKILDIAECKPAEDYEDGSGSGCASTLINIGKNHTTVSICDEYTYPTAFIIDGLKFSGNRKVAFIGIENLIRNVPVYTLAEIQNKLEYPDYTKEV